MFNEIAMTICTSLALQNGCNQALQASGAQTHISKTLDDFQNEFIKEQTKSAYNLLGKKTMDYSISAGTIASSIINRDIKFETPFNLIKCNVIMDLNEGMQAYNLNLKWNWK